MGKAFHPRATIGQLQDELLDALEGDAPVDGNQVRIVNDILGELRQLFIESEVEPDSVEVEEEIVSMVREEIAKVTTITAGSEHDMAQD